MKEEFEARIAKIGFVGQSGWIEETIVDVGINHTFEDFIEKFEGKKVKITIEEIK